MRKISEYKDEEALDLLADLIEPAVAIVQDKAFTEAYRAGRTATAVKLAIKNHKPQVMEILARLDNVPVAEYHCNFVTLPMRLLEVLNDEALVSVFTSPEATNTPSGSSGSVTAITGAPGE